MRAPELEAEFPGLLSTAYEVRSPHDPKYNCIAYAIGDMSHFWYDAKVKGYYWPPGEPSADTLDGWLKVFALHGYRETDDDALEPSYEKIAIYAGREGPEHVARQRGSGLWTSKMGKGRDIDHATLASLEGDSYGRVVKIMKRPCKEGKRVLE
ncbi:MAG: hypothetical protein ABSG13_31385 [Bryobacteraceae bacterium]|jgi:hypothetical protein